MSLPVEQCGKAAINQITGAAGKLIYLTKRSDWMPTYARVM